MKAFVDKTGCICCGLCTSICPVVFDIGEDGRAIVVVDNIPEGSYDLAVDAEKSCPASVISLE